MAIALPVALGSVVAELTQPPEGDIFTIPVALGAPPAPTGSRLHLSVTDLDEARLQVTLRVSGHHACAADCPYTDRIMLFSLGTNEALTAGMPPSAKVDLSTTEQVVTANVTLPVRGNPSRYPFDTYEMWLAVGLARVYPDGSVQPVSRADAAGHLVMTLQEQLPREEMARPVTLAPDTEADDDAVYQMQSLQVLRFSRSLHEIVLAVLLVLLIAAAAAYAVFMQPLHNLVLNSGALVLGVWGVRSLLTPGTAYRTVVDLALSAVILFLLGAITIRALQHCYARSEFRPRPAPPPPDSGESKPAT
ncbi:MAG TPA: hypothetical protein VII06_34330 [Chloroflexota bacterium]|jgi:hypothetical protein